MQNADVYQVQALTRGPKFHFKAYYDMQPWDASGRYFLCMASDFQDHPPAPGDRLTIGVVDLASREFQPVAQTTAWNFQQGCMPHWLSEREIIFNDIINGECHSFVLDMDSRAKTRFSMPIQALSHAKGIAASLNYARWGEWRPGYGYAGLKDPFAGQNCPPQDAVYIIDLTTGKTRPVVTMAEVAARTSDLDARRGAPMHLCHLIFNPDGTRLAGLARMWCPHLAGQVRQVKVNIDGAVPERRHCLWVVNSDGTGLDIIVSDGLVSHATWRDCEHILFWGSGSPGEAPAYYLYNVTDKTREVIGAGYLTVDGHMSYHRNRRWLLTDTYPDGNRFRTLKIYDIEKDREIILGKFHAPDDLKGELRCDLHPCWNRDYTQVAIDSIHAQGQRQVYVVETGDLNEIRNACHR